MTILSNMIWVPKTEPINFEKLKKELTVIPKFDNLNPVETFIDQEDWFGIPRNYGQINDYEDQRVVGNNLNLKFKGELRPKQKPIIQDWQKLYDQGINDTIINVITGVGKTILSLKIACYLGIPFLVVVPQDRLLRQWREKIVEFTDIKEDEIGHIQQNTCDFKGKKCAISMVQSLYKDKYPEEMKSYFGLVIVDEVHQLAAESFSNVLKLFPAKYKLSLSATLERQDGLQNVYYYHLGQNIITSEEKTQPNPRIFTYQYNGSSGKLPFWLDKYDAIKVRSCILSNLAKNQERNELLAYFTDILIKKGLQTLVLSDRIDQLKEINNILHNKYGYPLVDLYISKTTEKNKNWLEKNSTHILATTKMLSVGIDVDTLRGLVFATPRSEVEQSIGRIRRINKELPDPVVIDTQDTYYPQALGWAKKRMKYYEREEFEVVDING